MGERGNVFAASASSIGIRFRYRGVACEERLKLAPTPRHLAFARNLRGRIMDEIARGLFDYAAHFPDSARARLLTKDPGSLDTVGERLESWLEAVRPMIARSTWLGYDKAVRNVLVPQFGKLRLRELSRSAIRTWIGEQDTTAKRINNVLTPLRQMLSEALSDGSITADPTHGLTVRRKGPREDDIDPFSPDECAAILAQCDGQFRNLVAFALWTGMRTSELIGLRWQDVDWRRGLVLVRQALVAGEVKGTKTDAGRREIKLLPPALDALKAQKSHTLLAGDRVFHDPRTGEPWLGDKQIREWHWRPALKRAGVRYRYPYQTRHTYASTLLSAGENPVWVASQMGHKDWVMIVRTYGRWIPSVDPTAGAKVAAICGGLVEHTGCKPQSN
jgi:integrase